MIWKGTKVELITFIKELNEKHKTIKFDFQISPRKIAFLDAMLYKDKNNYIQTTLYRKPTYQQAFLQTKSEHPRSLKNSITYSQALRLKIICSTITEYDKNCATIRIVTDNIKKKFWMKKPRKFIELKEKNYS